MTAISYNVQVDQAAVFDAITLFEFVGGNSADALRIAINKTAPKIRTLASKHIRSQVRLSASYVNERLVIAKATKRQLNAAIRAQKRGMLLSRFSTDPLIAGEKVGWIKPPLVPKSGIKFKIKPSGSVQSVYGDPFYMVLNGGANVAIVERKTQARSPIHVFYGPSLSQVFNTARDEVLPPAGAELQTQLLDAMRYLLVKKYPPEAAL